MAYPLKTGVSAALGFLKRKKFIVKFLRKKWALYVPFGSDEALQAVNLKIVMVALILQVSAKGNYMVGASPAIKPL